MAEAKEATAPSIAKGTAAKTPGAQTPTIRVRQIGSPIGRRGDQRATLIGLGLNKMHRTRVLPDTPAVRGMINKVKHLVQVDGDC